MKKQELLDQCTMDSVVEQMETTSQRCTLDAQIGAQNCATTAQKLAVPSIPLGS
jgi:hypothetical protein